MIWRLITSTATFTLGLESGIPEWTTSDFERANTVVRPLGVVPRGLVVDETGGLDGGVVSVFLGVSAKKHAIVLHRDGFESVAQDREVRQPRETDLFEDTGHFAQEINVCR